MRGWCRVSGGFLMGSVGSAHRKPLKEWSWRRGLNPRPSDYKSDALPTELRQLMFVTTATSAHRWMVTLSFPSGRFAYNIVPIKHRSLFCDRRSLS